MEKMSANKLLATIKNDKDARLTHEQILVIMKSLSELMPEQADIVDDYFRRVPFSHPRWWHY